MSIVVLVLQAVGATVGTLTIVWPNIEPRTSNPYLTSGCYIYDILARSRKDFNKIDIFSRYIDHI